MENVIDETLIFKFSNNFHFLLKSVKCNQPESKYTADSPNNRSIVAYTVDKDEVKIWEDNPELWQKDTQKLQH